MMNSSFATIAILLCAATAPGQTKKLFNGKDLSGWKQPVGAWKAAGAVPLDPADAKKFKIEPGTGVLVNGEQGKTSNLFTEEQFGDVEAHVEFVVPKGSNSGVYFESRYEIQVLDSWGVKDLKYGDCGGVYASCSEPKPAFKGRAPSLNASKPPGEWQTFDIVFRAPRFDASGKKTDNARFVKVTHNGKVIHENVEVPRPTCAAASLDEKPVGPLMLQGDHGPVAYRNLTIKPVKLN
jgi:3-keto-disaccharide hydrolase